MTIKIEVPATIANMGPGFDTCGLAVDLFNTFTFNVSQDDQVFADEDSSQDTSTLPTNPAENIIFPAMDRFYQEIGKKRPPVHVTLKIDVPVARGLGSSSTAVVAGLLAANQIEGNPLDNIALLKLAVELEGHPDNVAPAILGGMVVSDNEQYAVIDWPDDWKIIAVIPDYAVMTAEARKAMPKTYSLDDVVFNLRKQGLLISAVHQKNPSLLRSALFDKVHQPYRQPLIAEFDEVAQFASENGALGTVVSGSGSTMAIISEVDSAQGVFDCLQEYSTQNDKTLTIKLLNRFTRL